MPDQVLKLNNYTVTINSENDLVMILEKVIAGVYDSEPDIVDQILDKADEWITNSGLTEKYDKPGSIIHKALDYNFILLGERFKSYGLRELEKYK